jgi:hypothetical protein
MSNHGFGVWALRVLGAVVRHLRRSNRPAHRGRVLVAFAFSLGLLGALEAAPGAAFAAGLPSSLAMYRVGQGDFSGCVRYSNDQVLCSSGDLRDGDNISLDVQGGAPYGIQPWQTRVTFYTSSNITWWKEISAWNAAGYKFAAVSLMNSQHGPQAMTFETGSLGALVFSKAKTFGIHTGVYDLRDFRDFAGKNVIFTWTRD